MNCKRVNDLISFYIDNEVSKEEKTLLEEHMKTCDSCKEKYEQMKTIVNYLNDSEEVELPNGYDIKLREKLYEEKSRTVTKFNWKYISTLAATLLILITSVSLIPKLQNNFKQHLYMKNESVEDYQNVESAPNVELADDASKNKSIGLTERYIKDEYSGTEPMILIESYNIKKSTTEIINITINNDGIISLDKFINKEQKKKELVILVPSDKINKVVNSINKKMRVTEMNFEENNLYDLGSEHIQLRIIITGL